MNEQTPTPSALEEGLRRHLQGQTVRLKLEESTAYASPPPLPSEMIQGVLRHGHKLLLAGPSDSGKTSFLISMALSVSQGKPFLGLNTDKSNVLFVNLELESASFLHRLHQVAAALGLSAADKRFAFVNHRGGNMDPATFCQQLRELLIQSKLNGREFRMVVLDPVYKLIGAGGRDEESNRRVSDLITGLGSISDLGDVGFILSVDVQNDHPRYRVTHETENGTGQLAKDADAVFVLWPLEGKSHAYRLKADLREFESFKPLSLAFEFPIFKVNPELDKWPIVGSVIDSGVSLDPDGGIDIWKLWGSLDTTEPVGMDVLAKKAKVTVFELKSLIMQAPANPTNPKMKLRLLSGNKVKAEED